MSAENLFSVFLTRQVRNKPASVANKPIPCHEMASVENRGDALPGPRTKKALMRRLICALIVHGGVNRISHAVDHKRIDMHSERKRLNKSQ